MTQSSFGTPSIDLERMLARAAVHIFEGFVGLGALHTGYYVDAPADSFPNLAAKKRARSMIRQAEDFANAAIR